MSDMLKTKSKPKELIEIYFVHKGQHQYVCKLCYLDWSIDSNDSTEPVKTYNAAGKDGKLKNGFIWGTQHIMAKHPNYNFRHVSNHSHLLSTAASVTY